MTRHIMTDRREGAITIKIKKTSSAHRKDSLTVFWKTLIMFTFEYINRS